MKAYYYLFYKLYKFWENGHFTFWSEWKASISIIVLQIWFILSLFVYYKIFINRYIHLAGDNIEIYLVAIPIWGINYFIFHHHSKWRSIVVEFDKLPQEKNKIGGIIVWSIIILVVVNVIFSFYLMSQTDWSQYR